MPYGYEQRCLHIFRQQAADGKLSHCWRTINKNQLSHCAVLIVLASYQVTFKALRVLTETPVNGTTSCQVSW
ncbi:hypothetical protein ACFFW8_12190 [Erwinia tracheiphila]